MGNTNIVVVPVVQGWSTLEKERDREELEQRRVRGTGVPWVHRVQRRLTPEGDL